MGGAAALLTLAPLAGRDGLRDERALLRREATGDALVDAALEPLAVPLLPATAPTPDPVDVRRDVGLSSRGKGGVADAVAEALLLLGSTSALGFRFGEAVRATETVGAGRGTSDAVEDSPSRFV